MGRRPFRGLRDRPPRPRYDAVVVGAGVGGLCANLLAREGLSVLLVEQHYMVGGLCSTFRRGGFTFDAASHFYPLLGNPDTLTGRLLRDLGVDIGWVKMDPVDTFHLPDGSRFAVPANLDTYLAAVKARFPHQAAALDRFFAAVREAYLVGLLAHFRDHETPVHARLAAVSLREALDRHFDDPHLALLLTADCPHWGSPPSRTSFVFDSMLRLAYFLGNYYPAGGSQAFADALAARFEERGGDILMSTRVDRILVEGGAAVGIEGTTDRGRLTGRHRVAAESVVSNTDLRLLLHELLPPAAAPAAARARIAALRPSWPCYLTHVGLDGVGPADLEAAQGYHWRRWNSDEKLGDVADFRAGALACKLFVPTLFEPAMAPPGKQVVILQKVMPVDYQRIDDWPAHKQQVQDFLLAQLEAALPGVSRHVEVAITATARTAWRFTLNEHGAMLGWEMAPDQLAVRPGARGPVRNLYLTGHWVRPGGGITPVIVSALHAAEALVGRRLADT